MTGVLAGAAPAVSIPPLPLALECDQPIFNGFFGLKQNNSFRVETTLFGDNDDGSAVSIDPLGNRNNGRAHGTIAGGAVILEIHWDGGAYGVYEGQWDSDGFVHGSTYDGTRARVVQASWHSSTRLGCPSPPPETPLEAEPCRKGLNAKHPDLEYCPQQEFDRPPYCLQLMGRGQRYDFCPKAGWW